jgi:tetratricopeptide (TPR) repeat protein
MKPVSRFALAVALVSMSMTSAVSVSAAEEKPKKEKKEKKGKEADPAAKPQAQFSNEFRAAYIPANEAYEKTKDYAKAASLLPALFAVTKGGDEKLQAGRLALLVGQASNDIALQKQGVAIALGSETMSAEMRGIYTFQRALFANNDKDFAGALPDFLAAYELGYRKGNIEFNIGNAYQQTKNNAEALNWYQKAAQAAIASNTVADRAIFVRGITIAGNMRDAEKVRYWGTEMIRAYPDSKSYRDAAVFLDSVAGLDVHESLDLMRLARLNNALITETDYRTFVEASAALYPAEALAVMRAGGDAKAINLENTFFKPQLAAAITNEAALREGLDADEKSALASAKGISAALMGDSMLAFGEYARAQKLYEAALQKGSLIDVTKVDVTERTRTRLAITKAMQGDYAGAKTDFAAVSGANRKAIADYWMIYLAQKGA